ncbi:hypothetical protein ACSFA7_22610 [Variovorax sp. LT1R20]|uniref:hypothetical protein n=1 Tax=Variovorax sp. LT1R20 TaxID=3443729 RepID=UPI003F48F9B4
MARIRSIKPEFWTSEQIMNLCPLARLAFIGLWNFCDDGGNHPASARTLKAEVFPGDDALTSIEVDGLVAEMLAQGLLVAYEAGGKSYWHTVGWHHQRIDKPTMKHPPFAPSATPARLPAGDDSRSSLGVLDEESTNALGALTPGVEGKGDEGRGDDEDGESSAAAEPSSAGDNCPHQQIIDLYHELLPTARRVSEWTPARQQVLRARWREKPERQKLDWWRDLFEYIAKSDFLCGRTTPTPGRPPFYLSLDWLCTSRNFLKVIEGAYEN